MQDFVVVTWDFDGKGGARAAMALLQQCDLRHEARQSADAVADDPASEEAWSTGSFGSVRLKREDPRFGILLRELQGAGVEAQTRVDRTYSRKDLEQAAWLRVASASSMVEAGKLAGQRWDMAGACATCGAGAVPIPPLIARLERMNRQGWVVASSGLVIVSAEVATSLLQQGLTGFSVEAVRTPSGKAPDGRYRWLRITRTWPACSDRSTWKTDGPCSKCGRPGRFWPLEMAPELHYDSVPNAACDFNHSWEQIGYFQPPGRGSREALNVPTGAAAEVLLSQRAYRALKEAGVRSLRCEPLFLGTG